jgi:hypothetical protein
MANYLSNGDKILQKVLSNPKLMELGNYDLSEVDTIEDALVSENHVIKSVAMLIECTQAKQTPKEIYNQVSSYLKEML